MAYDVHLEIFEGPLDLLLYLIKKDDLEIAEIPIAQITTEYLSYLELMKELNLEVAGDFLVMASTLMQIKARMLLPSAETEQEEGPDPLEELKARLLEYQKYKEVAQLLGHKEIEYAHVYYRPAPAFEKDDYTLEATLFDLMEGFRSVLKELPKDVKEIVYKEIPIEIKIREILDLFETNEHVSFRDILRQQPDRHSLVVAFLAILELVRLKQIVARQTELFDEIRIYRVRDDGDPAAGTPETQGAEALKGTELYAAHDAAAENIVPESAAPEASAPVTAAAGETPAPETPAAESSAPEVREPGTPVAESVPQEVTATETTLTGSIAREAPAPETPAAEEPPAPETPAAESPAPEVRAPETPVMEPAPREVAETGTTLTGSSIPEAPLPETPATDSPVPEAYVPETQAAELPAPERPIAASPAEEAPAPEARIEMKDTGPVPEDRQ